MAELDDTPSEADFFKTVEQDELYSYNECKKIGKDFLNELKQSIIVDNLPESDIEEPQVKATKYLEETESLQLLEVSVRIFNFNTRLLFKFYNNLGIFRFNSIQFLPNIYRYTP